VAGPVDRGMEIAMCDQLLDRGLRGRGSRPACAARIAWMSALVRVQPPALRPADLVTSVAPTNPWLLGAQTGNASITVCVEFDEALAFEATQRLSQGCRADADPACQLPLLKDCARGSSPTECARAPADRRSRSWFRTDRQARTSSAPFATAYNLQHRPFSCNFRVGCSSWRV
jgi:hypothetical protein